MSLVIRRSINLFKYIEYIQYNPIRNFYSKSINSSNCKRILVSSKRLPDNYLLTIRNLSTKTTEINDLSEELNRFSQKFDKRDETTMQTMDVHSVNITDGRTGQLSNDKIQEFWQKYDIQVHGRDAPLPVLDMDGYEWPESIRQALDADGFQEPTPIQCQGWPIVLSGRDMVGVAQTGSGKTLCYVLPAFVKLVREGTKRGPKCLILAPTRELAQQIQSVVRRYEFANNVCLFGGASRLPQMQILREQNPQIIIATPGRMIDFVESNCVDLKTVDYLVLDEADRMLDMGFEPQIRKIIDNIPEDRQTVMWSATWPKDVRQLAAHYMKDYIQINVGGVELTANKNIEQNVEVCDDYDKKRKLFDLLNKIRADLKENKTLVFAKTKHSVDYLTNEMRSNGWPAISIHGDKTQFIRDKVLNDFRAGRFPILVATDVAARGLDVDDIKFVINYDYPNTCEDYVHRIGRTGRLDRKGTAYTFFSSSDGKQANELIEVLRESNQTISPELLQMAQMSRNTSDINKRRRYGNQSYSNSSYRSASSYGNNPSYGYQNKAYPNSGYQRSGNYNKYEGQRRRPAATQSGYGGTGGYSSGGYGSNPRPNYRTNYEPTYGSTYDSTYGSSHGPPYRGF